MLSFLSLEYTVLFLLFYIIIFTFFTLFYINKVYAKSIALMFGVLGIGYILITIVNILGNPRPAEIAFFSKEKYYIISSISVENKEIYLWAVDLESNKPIYFVVPWSETLAKNLQKVKIQAQNTGGNIVFLENTENKNTENQENMMFAVEAPDVILKDVK